ncbi:hypothetical protein BHU72_10190 [Desulfuribacillus stibiiarsenatis]|uniref:Thioredoxin-like fold domain-containing protein n=1 Tax=Desulfuribacillus stibiiarsenatis TaxID=1390249 RepID=A0A1E5L915_9FIRM|nr:hypothetical protein [Desulfuribacillus stibiiarsenatis]OEH86616.1 hypothetical protein BHU72_10190 [Desulfuribacillus stibiiarsenatis]
MQGPEEVAEMTNVLAQEQISADASVKFINVFSQEAVPFYDDIKKLQAEGRPMPALFINGELRMSAADLSVDEVLKEMKKSNTIN